MQKILYTLLFATTIVYAAEENSEKSKIKTAPSFYQTIVAQPKNIYASWIGAAFIGNLLTKQRRPIISMFGLFASGFYIFAADSNEFSDSLEKAQRITRSQLYKVRNNLQNYLDTLDQEAKSQNKALEKNTSENDNKSE